MKRITAVLVVLAAGAIFAVVRPVPSVDAAPPKTLLAGAVSFTSGPVQIPGAFVAITAMATCGTGYDVTGGGYTISPDPTGFPVPQVISSRVVTSPPGWQVRVVNESGSGYTINVEAVCHLTS